MKIILAITGASGSIYAKTFIEQIVESKQVSQLAIVRSDNAQLVWDQELNMPWIEDKIIQYYHKQDFTAPFASGSSLWDAMVVLPSSMGVLGRIANGFSDDLICRAADVMLKEHRKLIICPRETPFNAIHLKNMLNLHQAGAVILPTIPSFYHQPKTVTEVSKTLTDRVLDNLSIKHNTHRWGTENQ